MNSNRIKNIFRNPKIGQMVEISGWVRTKRDSNGGFSFLEINDGSSLKNIQVIADNNLPNYTDVILNIKTGAGVTVKGTLKESQGKGQLVELLAEEVILHCNADSSFPLQKKRHTLEYLRTIAHLRPRTNLFGAVSRIRSAMSFAIHDFFNKRDFLYVHTPLITASDCEGAGEMFRVTTLDLMNLPKENGKIDYSKDFFAKPSFLTVSGQLEGEIFASAMGDIYTFGPTFRAENSNTSRHLSEFWMIEPEMAFCDINGDMDVAESFIKYIIKYLLENNSEDMEFFNSFVKKGLIAELEHVMNSDFERLTYTEAVSILENSNEKFEYPVKWGIDLQSEHERYLTEKKIKKPVILTDYPKDIKAFYMRENEDGKTVRAMDVLVPGIGEIIGGSQREERHDVLVNKIKAMGLDTKDYWWYLELRKFGSVPHSGFGLGFERMIQYVTGVENIRDVIPFPRYPGHAEF